MIEADNHEALCLSLRQSWAVVHTDTELLDALSDSDADEDYVIMPMRA